VGIIKLRKNVENIVRGFHRFVQTHPEAPHKLLIGGNAAGAYADKVRRYIADNKLGDRVTFLGHLNDGMMSYLYRRAAALVFPTLIEGFGFPVLEAMSVGVPVVASAVGGVPEVAGYAALLVPPEDPDALAAALHTAVHNEDERARLIAVGQARARAFTWDAHARGMVALWQAALEAA